MFRTTILYLQETNEKQTRWSDFWCLQAWIAILLWIVTSLIKGKLKSQFIQFPSLNSFHFFPGYCNLKSQTETSTGHLVFAFVFIFAFRRFLCLPGSRLYRSLNTFEGSWCVGDPLSHPYGEITQASVVCRLPEFPQLSCALVAFSSSCIDKAHFITLFPLLSLLLS